MLDNVQSVSEGLFSSEDPVFEWLKVWAEQKTWSASSVRCAK